MKINLQRAITSLTSALDYVGVDEVHHAKRVALMAGGLAFEMGWDPTAVRDMMFTQNQGARARYRNAVARTQPTLSELDHLVFDPEVHKSIDYMRLRIEEEFRLLSSLAGEPGAPALRAL